MKIYLLCLFILNAAFIPLCLKASYNSEDKSFAEQLREKLNHATLGAAQSDLKKIKNEDTQTEIDLLINGDDIGLPQSAEFVLAQETIGKAIDKIVLYFDTLGTFSALLKRYDGNIDELKKDQTFISIKPLFKQLVVSLRTLLPMVIPIFEMQAQILKDIFEKAVEEEFGQFEIWQGIKAGIDDFGDATFDFIKKDVVKFLQKLTKYINEDENIKSLIED